MKKIFFWVVGIAIVIQFIRPDFTNAKVDETVAPGRKALDFSNWKNIDTQVRLERLKCAKKLVNNEMMPNSDFLDNSFHLRTFKVFETF